MPQYTIRLGVSIGGKNIVVIDSPEEYEVGQTVSVSPGPGGFSSGGVSMGQGVSMSGQVIEKR